MARTFDPFDAEQVQGAWPLLEELRRVCPGASLARTIARIGMEALFERFPPGTLRAAPGYRYENVPTFFECGPRALLVETPV